jgi:methionyl-tRNA synthetase
MLLRNSSNKINSYFYSNNKLNHDTESKRYTITAALPYTNGPIHIGHLAGVYVPSDIYSVTLG